MMKDSFFFIRKLSGTNNDAFLWRFYATTFLCPPYHFIPLENLDKRILLYNYSIKHRNVSSPLLPFHYSLKKLAHFKLAEFPNSYPHIYWPGATLLNFRDRTISYMTYLFLWFIRCRQEKKNVIRNIKN